MKEKYLGHLIVSLLKAFSSLKPNGLVYLETGTMRHAVPGWGEPLDARSTLAAARWLQAEGHTGYSIDNFQPHVDLSKQVLAGESLTSVEVLCGDGPATIKLLPVKQVDFVLLDSDSCEFNTWNEYETVVPYLRRPALVVIDDINRHGVNKGKKVLAHLDKLSKHLWDYVDQHVVAIPFGDAAEQCLYTWRRLNGMA